MLLHDIVPVHVGVNLPNFEDFRWKIGNFLLRISSEDSKLLDVESKKILKDFVNDYEKITKVTKESIEKIVNNLMKKHKTNFKGIGQPLRIVLTGSKFGPGLYNIILSLDKTETIKRLKVVK